MGTTVMSAGGPNGDGLVKGNVTPTPEPAPVKITAAMLAAGIGLGNLGAVRVADPAVTSAINYLVSLGAPAPTKLEDDVAVFPGGSFLVSLVTWQKQGLKDLEIEAGYMAAKPTITAVLLGQAGYLKLPDGYSIASIPAYQAAALLPPPVNTTAPAPSSSCPIGQPIVPGHSAVGDEFNPSMADSVAALPIGSVWRNSDPAAPSGQYVKTGAMNPFGPSVKWLRLT